MSDNPQIEVHKVFEGGTMGEEEREAYERFTAVVTNPEFMEQAGECAAKMVALLPGLIKEHLAALVPEILEEGPLPDPDQPGFMQGRATLQLYQEFTQTVLIRVLAGAVAATMADVGPEYLIPLLQQRVNAVGHNVAAVCSNMMREELAEAQAVASTHH